LTLDCEYPVLETDTYRALLVLAEQRGEALQECTSRLRAIRGEK
jgi:hypothetical protein